MPYDDERERPDVDAELAGGSCPHWGQAIAVREIESADGGIEFVRAAPEE